jgi:nitrite reductase/ring-hydroxylating ferredoxin subunit
MPADHGGPLLNGDIEEMGGKVTIKCPWHEYQIALESGEGLYMGVDMVRNSAGRIEATPPRVKSKGLKQRTHFVRVRDGDVFVADTSKLGA